MTEKELIKSSKKFTEIDFKKYQHKFKELVEKGQNPKTLFIGCCDSRVLPNLITNTGPGDLFVIRNIGNFVPPFSPDHEFHSTAAGIEYAVSVLEVEDIVVCGHSHCGAISSLYKPKQDKPELIHTYKWLELGKEVKDFVSKLELDKETSIKKTEKYSTLFQLTNLLTYPAVKQRVEEGKLFLNAWYYELESGKIEYFNFEKAAFEEL